MNFLSGISSTVSDALGVTSIIGDGLVLTGTGSMIGSFGDVVFSASSFRILTINNYRRSTKARLATHEIIGQKPVIEFLGADGEEISFSMQFLASMGVNPASEAEKVRQMCQTGQTEYFVLGNECIGGNKWLISDVSESADVIDNHGRILVSKLEVTLKEYVDSFA